jgi:hypothetical protein
MAEAAVNGVRLHYELEGQEMRSCSCMARYWTFTTGMSSPHDSRIRSKCSVTTGAGTVKARGAEP